MRKRRRIDNNAVKMTVSILNSGNYIALIIALQQLHLYAKAVSRRANVSTQAVIIITAIDISRMPSILMLGPFKTKILRIFIPPA